MNKISTAIYPIEYRRPLCYMIDEKELKKNTQDVKNLLIDYYPKKEPSKRDIEMSHDF